MGAVAALEKVAPTRVREDRAAVASASASAQAVQAATVASTSKKIGTKATAKLRQLAAEIQKTSLTEKKARRKAAAQIARQAKLYKDVVAAAKKAQQDKAAAEQRVKDAAIAAEVADAMAKHDQGAARKGALQLTKSKVVEKDALLASDMADAAKAAAKKKLTEGEIELVKLTGYADGAAKNMKRTENLLTGAKQHAANAAKDVQRATAKADHLRTTQKKILAKVGEMELRLRSAKDTEAKAVLQLHQAEAGVRASSQSEGLASSAAQAASHRLSQLSIEHKGLRNAGDIADESAAALQAKAAKQARASVGKKSTIEGQSTS